MTSTDPNRQKNRVLCGGSWNYNPLYARVTLLNWYYPDFSLNNLGFRVVSPVVSGA